MKGEHDVIVIGAGPAGAASAARLALGGARVALVERREFPREKLCGGFVSVESRSLLRAAGIEGLPPAGSFSLIETLTLSTPTGRRVETPIPAWEQDAEGLAWGISRSVLDSWILESAARAGCDVMTGVEASGVTHDASGGWVLEGRLVPRAGSCRLSGPGLLRLRAPVLIAADGRHSRLARWLAKRRIAGHEEGLLPPRTPGRRTSRAFGFQALFEAPAAKAGAVEIHFFRGGYLGLQRVGSGLTNACGLVDPERAGIEVSSLDALLRETLTRSPLARERLEGARRAAEWHSAGGLRFGAGSPVLVGAFFAGDASGTIEPFTGEGIAMALASSALLHRCLAPFLEGKTGRRAAARRYARAWRRSFLARLTLCRLLSRLACSETLLEAAVGLMCRRESVARALFHLTRTDGIPTEGP